MVEENSHLSWTIQTRTGFKRKLPALEIAIISESKVLLSSSACQMVVNAIFEGRVIYTPTSFIDILPDHYKQKPISLYNPRKAPLFNQYRLIVPRTRNILEVCQFIILLVLFLLVMSDRDASAFGMVELIFIIYTIGWVLDQFVSSTFSLPFNVLGKECNSPSRGATFWHCNCPRSQTNPCPFCFDMVLIQYKLGKHFRAW